ncbi:hypothetical protein A3K73_05030 [Candidatus Pacearchaeota archaeon RBG_13_36_9]|nr:MAG: hypothetical protein A3K73_05030 [Candidatus Pacearchaeota archaeon RBG_13_36_9]
MQSRKTRVIDGTDREILRALYEKRPLAGRQIARRVGITSSAVAPRLNNLMASGIIKKAKVEAVRHFQREINGHSSRVNSPRRIIWDLDIKY